MRIDINQVRDELGTAVKTYSGAASFMSPDLLALLALGQVLAKLLPEIYKDIVNLINAKEPSPQREAELAVKIKQLMDFDSI